MEQSGIRKQLKRLAPPAYLSRRARTHSERVRSENGIPALAQEFVERHGSSVLRGPFEGLSYPPAMVPGIDIPIPKLAGTYEHDIYPHIPTEGRVVDIGCAEGFYAVGLALRGLDVIAYDVDWKAQKLCKRLAKHNGVDVSVRAVCVPSDLLAQNGAFILSDCEGAEVGLFTPEVVSALRGSTLLIELHGTREEIEDAFRASHDMRLIEQTPSPMYPELEGLPREATSEFRPKPAEWALLTPAG